MSHAEADREMDINLVEKWLRRDPRRWLAGAVAGAFAGVVALAFAMVLCAATGRDLFFPAKLIGTILLGAEATAIDAGMGAVLAGFILIEIFSAVWGFAYAHFVYSNRFNALLPMGVVWALFAWIFWWNLYLPAIPTIQAAHVGPGPAFPVLIVWGLSLSSVAFFSRALEAKLATARR